MKLSIYTYIYIYPYRLLFLSIGIGNQWLSHTACQLKCMHCCQSQSSHVSLVPSLSLSRSLSLSPSVSLVWWFCLVQRPKIQQKMHSGDYLLGVLRKAPQICTVGFFVAPHPSPLPSLLLPSSFPKPITQRRHSSGAQRLGQLPGDLIF